MSQKEQPRSPELADLLRLAVQANQADLHVSLPGRIEAYDVAAQRADVQPLLRRTLVAYDGTELPAESLPILHDVPIVFPRGGQGSGVFFISWPLARGDLVHLIFVERSMDQWLAGDGAETTPLDYRLHHLSDAVAYPGLYPAKVPLADADAENLALGRDGDGMQLHVTPSDVAEFRVGGAADVSVAIAETLQSWWDTQVKPKLTAFDAHVHPTGVGPSGPPSPTIGAPSMDTAVISDRLKLKDN